MTGLLNDLLMRNSWIREDATNAIADAEKLLAEAHDGTSRIQAVSMLAILHGIKALNGELQKLLEIH